MSTLRVSRTLGIDGFCPPSPSDVYAYGSVAYAIPLPHDRAPGAEILDPAEPAGRARITELYLAGRGIPREQWGAYRAVAENLWSGDQPKLAEQALRLAAEGLSRDVILDKLVQDG